MADKVKEYRERRYLRLLARMDDDSGDGHWVTTENDHHIHINENGEPDMGNPYVIAAMTGKPPRVGLSDKQKKVASLLGKGFDSIDPVKEELSGLSYGSMILIRTQDGWANPEVKSFVMTKDGDFFERGTGELHDPEDMAMILEQEDDPEFDLYEGDEVKSFLSASSGKKTKDLEKMLSGTRLYIDSERAEVLDKLEHVFEDAPEGTRIELPDDMGRWRKKKKGDSDVWIKSLTKEEVTDAGMRDLWDDYAVGHWATRFSAGVKYAEPTSGYKGSFSEGHKVFSDKHSGTHTYAGTGAKTVEFFSQNSNYDELISDMDSDQIDTFQMWTMGHFMRGQQYQGWDNMSKGDREITKTMDEVLDRSRLDEPIVVTRLSNASLVLGKGNKQPLLSELRAMKGKKVVSKGAMSCAAASDGLTIGARDKAVEYHISVPAGIGYGMWVGDRRINGWGPEQREFVLNRDAQYEVGETKYNASRGVFEVELKLTHMLEHDYGSNGK